LAGLTAADAKGLIFTLTDGTTVAYALTSEESVIMKFVNGQVVVNADTYEFSGVKYFRISDETPVTGIDSPTAESSAKVSEGSVVFAKAGTISVFSSDGRKVATAEGDTFNLNNLPKGVYVIKSGNSSIKVAKK